VPSRLDGPLTHDRASKLEVRALESDVVPVCEFDVVRAPKTGFQAVCAHASGEFVESPEVIGLILRLQVEISDRWMMRCVLTEYLCAVRILTLQSLSQDGIERLVLASTDVQTTQRKSDHLLESFQVILCLSCLLQVLGCERPEVNYALNGTSRFKDFNGKRDVSNGKALKQSHCQLFYHID
jgi:hypothetical protein